MMKKCSHFKTALGLLVAVTMAPMASANPGPLAEVICAPKAQMQARLETQFGAKRAWQGVRGPEQIMEIWEDQRGDWTMTIAYAEGHLCIVAMGSELMPYTELAFQ